MGTIIEDIKTAIGIPTDNLAFDGELVMALNANKAILIQQGVSQLDITINETTFWPTFDNDVVGELSKQFLALKVRIIFDPIASETIQNTMDRYINELQARIKHEIEDEADV